MSDVKTKAGMKFIKHRPKDPLDPGFSITGIKFKWMSPQKTEDRTGGIWETLRPGSLPESVVSEMKKNGLFAKGDTIRNNELVLGFCSDEVHAEMRKEKKALADEQLRRVGHNPYNAGGTISVTDAKVSRGSEDAFRD